VADLKRGPCGNSFVTAFSCFHLSTAQPRGCDCLAANIAFAVRGVSADWWVGGWMDGLYLGKMCGAPLAVTSLLNQPHTKKPGVLASQPGSSRPRYKAASGVRHGQHDV